MCRDAEHVRNRVSLALRMAEVLQARNVDPDTAESLGNGGRHVIAQLANPGVPGRKVKVPSEQTWIATCEVLRFTTSRLTSASGS